jgi:hypothetical protein
MSQAAETELLQRVWNYPLFAALYGRRSRRFGLGFEIAEGPFPYRSRHAALPLDEFEEALLVAAGTGVSGIPLWDGSRPPAVRRGDGRTFGSTAHGRDTALFFTNDRGVYVIDPADVTASKLGEIETPSRSTTSTASSSPMAGWRSRAGCRRCSAITCGTATCPARACSCRSAM